MGTVWIRNVGPGRYDQGEERIPHSYEESKNITFSYFKRDDLEGENMNIFVSGLNFRTASLGELERAFINQDELEYSLTKIKNEGKLDEVVLLSTCNRIEIYGVTS